MKRTILAFVFLSFLQDTVKMMSHVGRRKAAKKPRAYEIAVIPVASPGDKDMLPYAKQLHRRLRRLKYSVLLAPPVSPGQLTPDLFSDIPQRLVLRSDTFSRGCIEYECPSVGLQTSVALASLATLLQGID